MSSLLKNRVVLALLIVATLITVAGVIVAWPHRAEVGQFLQDSLKLVQEWLTSTSPVLYFGALVVLPVFGFPLSPFYLTAGAYGPVLGILGTAAGVSLNMLLSYWLARYILHPVAERLIRRSRYNIPKISPENQVSVTFLVRVCGMPYPLQNYILGLAHVPLKVYMAVSVPVQCVFAVAVILLGDSIFKGKFGQAAAALGFLVAIILAFKIIRKRLARNRDVEDPAPTA